MTGRASKVAPLLFGSGACALVYQVAWFREFRLIFGASTMATGAVLALFAAGLGIGGWVLGPRADQHSNPMRLYATLELGVAVSAAVTPALLWLVRRVYIAAGGTLALGLIVGTLVRLLLTAVVLGVPTLLMGGTLPAAARAVETDDDVGRRQVGWLYGINTLGAVVGCLGATFWLLEAIGTRRTLLIAVAVNVLVSLGAFWVARGAEQDPVDESSREGEREGWDHDGRGLTVRRFVVGAAAIVGFCFFVMEIVWYRMLGPLLGGTVFTFGLILAVALFGIGLGGALYGLLRSDREPSMEGFSSTALLEALCVSVPYALGDRIATFALGLRSLGMIGFAGHALGWVLVTVIVVLPAACIAGFQFPMLIALMGRGRSAVGRETGIAYAANTAGAIAGSLLGGFVLLPWLGAPGCWLAVAVLLVVLGLAAAVLSAPAPGNLTRFILPVALGSVVALLLRAHGPTAVWRHSPIGVGRVPVEATTSRNAWRNWTNAERRSVRWETDGVESSVALNQRVGFSFVINGKVDGHVRGDAPTQVMSGILGAILHPHPRSALVIGLGTGSSAGWLGAIPEMGHVDVVELEPAIQRVARDCAVVNRNVLDNPKVRLVLGDAREVLLTTRAKYDLIFSEPSNPYRAGIASLFTREYYEAVAARLEKDGLFLQWVQAYEVDPGTVRKIYATLASAFPSITTWELGAKDLLLIGSSEPVVLDAPALRSKIAEEPYKAALANAWRAIDLEGMLGHFLAGPSLARAIAEQEPSLNTDDRNVVEFAFARAANGAGGFEPTEILATARARGEGRPVIAGDVMWDRVEDRRITFRTSETESGQPPPGLNLAQKARAVAEGQYLGGHWQEGAATWRSQSREPEDPTELAIVGEMLADAGDAEALGYVEKLRVSQPVEADAILARLLARQGKVDEAISAIESAFERHRVDPWPWPVLMRHTVELAADLSTINPVTAARVYAAIKEPFVAHLEEEMRVDSMLVAAGQLPLEEACVEALSKLEPLVPWRLSVLSWRSRCYEATRHPLASRAARELDEFLAAETTPFGIGLTQVNLE